MNIKKWFQKTKPEPKNEPIITIKKKKKYSFSTDMPSKSKFYTESQRQADLQKSFQVEAPKFELAEDGTIKKTTFAMDSAFPGQKLGFPGSQYNISTDQFSWFASQGFIGYQACAMISQHWLVSKCCL